MGGFGYYRLNLGLSGLPGACFRSGLGLSWGFGLNSGAKRKRFLGGWFSPLGFTVGR